MWWFVKFLKVVIVIVISWDLGSRIFFAEILYLQIPIRGNFWTFCRSALLYTVFHCTLNTSVNVEDIKYIFFTDPAHWAKSVIELPCLSVCLSVGAIVKPSLVKKLLFVTSSWSIVAVGTGWCALQKGISCTILSIHSTSP